jgi:acyl-CoA reductase LuxC
MTMHKVPLIIRGEVIEDADVEYGGRNPETRFRTADVSKYIDRLPLGTPSAMADLYALSFDQVLDFLEELGSRLSLQGNPHLQEALALSIRTSGLGEAILRECYANLRQVFERQRMREIADILIGIPFLEGWVNTRSQGGTKTFVRAFGARSVHVIAGNVPTVSALTILRNTLTRSDMIIKTPSNDPLTAAAIARTMIDMAPDHPITRHLSVAYWKGGDDRVEAELYKPANVEKIVAWGGMASITHIVKYLQPGIDLITLDPKLSSTIIGREAFSGEERMREVAKRVALDIGVYNQQACLNARVVYIQTGTDAAGIAAANRFGKLVYEAIQVIPAHLSNPVRALDSALAEEIEGLRFSGDAYKTFGGDGRGGVIVSQSDQPVEFAPLLANRVANLVPIDDLEAAISAVTSYTQTIGIYPDELIPKIRDQLAYAGAQRLVTLGYVAPTRSFAGPQDGMEPLRRMCKWILSEVDDSAVTPYWPWPEAAAPDAPTAPAVFE